MNYEERKALRYEHRNIMGECASYKCYRLTNASREDTSRPPKYIPNSYPCAVTQLINDLNKIDPSPADKDLAPEVKMLAELLLADSYFSWPSENEENDGIAIDAGLGKLLMGGKL